MNSWEKNSISPEFHPATKPLTVEPVDSGNEIGADSNKFNPENPRTSEKLIAHMPVIYLSVHASRLFTVPYFSVKSRRSIVEFKRSPSFFLYASETWREYKMPVPLSLARAPTHGHFNICTLPRFRSHTKNKMATARTQRSISATSRKNKGL